VPAAILALAAVVVAFWPKQESLAGLRTAGPYAVLGVALALAWWFNRGRSFVIAASLLAGFAAWQLFPTKALYTALVVIVPLNCLLAMVRAERGARYKAWHGWIFLLVVEAIVVTWIGAAGKSRLSGTWWFTLLDTWWLRSPPTPLIGRLFFAAAFVAALWRAWPDFRPNPVGNAGAIVAFFIATEWALAPQVYAMFMAASGFILVAALVQESHQLAFRDQLTGLPGRRALEERLRSLGARYAIAMLDVDHFKQFNDTHGHDVGDQVLKLVAGRLAEVDGGTAYRHGGEEFSVLFHGADLGEAEAAVEAIRESIQHYRMAVRAPDRPAKAEEGAKLRGAGGGGEKTLSVTVSAGVAAPSKTHATPHDVVMAADAALYRAKKAGRNRVSR